MLGASDSLLREVAPDLYVGSAKAAKYVDLDAAVAAFSSHSEDVFHPLRLRALFRDFEPVPHAIIESVVGFARAHRGIRPVMLQCYAGMNRSASMAYAVLRMVDGLSHDAALARVAHTVERHDRRETFPNKVTLGSVAAWCDERQNR